MDWKVLKSTLDPLVEKYNQPSFIEKDPISIPHKFKSAQDREIMGLWMAILAWGNRTTILNKGNELINLLDGSPYEFITRHRPKDLKRFESFGHRTFTTTDALHFIRFYRDWYAAHDSLEMAFVQFLTPESATIQEALNGFQRLFFDYPDAPLRTRKHIAAPISGSACKRLNMFLRWMVRRDDNGVDFGLWKNIRPAQLVCPIDVHVDRNARQLGLLARKQTDWAAALELTANLRQLDPDDPVKYDFALFGMHMHR